MIKICQFCQVIVEKVQGARIPDLDRKKYLVPGDLTGKCQRGQWVPTSLTQLSHACGKVTVFTNQIKFNTQKGLC